MILANDGTLHVVPIGGWFRMLDSKKKLLTCGLLKTRNFHAITDYSYNGMRIVLIDLKNLSSVQYASYVEIL